MFFTCVKKERGTRQKPLKVTYPTPGEETHGFVFIKFSIVEKLKYLYKNYTLGKLRRWTDIINYYILIFYGSTLNYTCSKCTHLLNLKNTTNWKNQCVWFVLCQRAMYTSAHFYVHTSTKNKLKKLRRNYVYLVLRHHWVTKIKNWQFSISHILLKYCRNLKILFVLLLLKNRSTKCIYLNGINFIFWTRNMRQCIRVFCRHL